MTFSLVDFEADPDGYNARLLEVLAMIDVVKPGLSTTVQDAGREGYYDVGIPPSGALDRFSLTAANLLVGNDAGAAGLEMRLHGTGAASSARTPSWRSRGARADAEGGRLRAAAVGGVRRSRRARRCRFAHLRGGARAYVAVAGGIDVPELLGSRSTYVLGALGGFEGRPLAAGDSLPVGDAGSRVVGRRGAGGRCGRRSRRSSRSAS